MSCTLQNFAGVLRSESSRLIITTLEQSFEQCRAFHDMLDTMAEDKYDTDFVNMVCVLLLLSMQMYNTQIWDRLYSVPNQMRRSRSVNLVPQTGSDRPYEDMS